MTVLFDSTILIYLLKPESNPPLNQETKQPVDSIPERIELLIKNLQDTKQKILIPTPVLAEVLIKDQDKGNEILQEFYKKKTFEIVAFDTKAAIETACLAREDNSKKDNNTTHAKIKFDRQILAIAIVNGVKTVYTDDIKLISRAKKAGIEAIPLSELPLSEGEQRELAL